MPDIPNRKFKALELRAMAWQIKDIAEELHVSDRTIRKWFKEPEVIHYWKKIKDVMIIEAKRILRAALIPAANKMAKLLKSSNEKTSFKAAVYILRTFGLQPPNVSIVLEKKQITVMKGILGESMERADRDGGKVMKL